MVTLQATRLGHQYSEARTWMVTAPSTTGQAIEDTFRENLETNRMLHPGYTANFKSRTLQKLSLWPRLVSIMMAQGFNHGFQEEGPR